MPEPAGGDQPPAPTPKPRHWLVGLALDALSTLVPAIAIALLIHVFLAQATRVYGQSMEPNLHTDQRLVIEKVSYRLHGPQRGDVVVIQDPTGGPELLIKRVIGLPGERITVTDGRVYVDGGQLVQSFLRAGLIADMVITTVPVLLGAGRRLFGALSADVDWTLVSSRSFASGLVQSSYRRAP